MTPYGKSLLSSLFGVVCYTLLLVGTILYGFFLDFIHGSLPTLVVLVFGICIGLNIAVIIINLTKTLKTVSSMVKKNGADHE